MTTEANAVDAMTINGQQNEVMITIEGRDVHIPMDSLGVTIDTDDRAILNAVRAIILENNGVDLNDEHGNVSYVVRKAFNDNVIHVYPKPIAGVMVQRRYDSTYIRSKGDKVRVNYFKPNRSNDLKRIGREMEISLDYGRTKITLNGSGINTLKAVLRQAGEI